MLQHCVFLSFKPTFTKAERRDAFERLAALVPEIKGLKSVEFGENLDFENKSAAFSDGFIATFTDRQALREYEVHAEHQKASAQLVEMCVGGHDGVIVFDLDVG